MMSTIGDSFLHHSIVLFILAPPLFFTPLMESVHIVVSGLVQGVGFRYFVYREAASLALNGYVRNLFTGEVETCAEGKREALEQLIERIRIGPRSAIVRDVSIRWGVPVGQSSGFVIQ